MQEAFYVMMEVDKRMETHLSIARILVKKGFSDPEALFTIAHHCSLSSDLVAKTQNWSERFTLIDIAFEAATKAKQVLLPPFAQLLLSLTIQL